MPNLNLSESPPPVTISPNGETSFFQPEHPSSNEESGEVKIYLVNHAQGDSNYYKRLGFYCALDTVQNPNAKFLDLLSEQKDFIKERRAGVQLYYFAKEERYNQRIEDTKLKISDEKVKLLGHVSELSETILELNQQEQEVSTLEEALSESIVILGKRKETLISDATHAVRNQMKELIENYRKVYEDRYSINERTYQDNRPALEIKVEKFRQLREVSENQWGRIVQIMQGLRLDGVNPFLARWLFVLGLGIATVCGAYFFSIFTLSKGLNDENVTFFLLSSLQNFIEHLFLPGTSIGGQFAILFGCLSALIILITAIAFWCWKLLGKFEPASAAASKADQRISFEANEEVKISLEFTTRSGNFYQFWLQVIPIIIITGIVLITVFLGLSNSPSTDGDILKKLDISLTGATIGALLTLMFAGISFLYIIKVVEPRAENRSENPNVYLNNIELFITALIFAVTTFSLFGLESGGNHQAILFEYVALVLSNGFLLGYALRLKGLFSSLGFLERKILMLTNAIRDNSRPRPLNFTSKEDQVFRKEYFRLQKELFHLMLLKTQLGNTAFGGNNANKTRQKESKWWKAIRKKSTDSNSVEDTLIEEIAVLADWEARLFPENHAVIQEMTGKLKRARAKRQEISDRVNMLKEGCTPYCDALKDNIRRLEDSLDATKRELEKILFNKARDFTALHILSDTIQADIREGFNLGMWFRSEVGPGDPPNGYYGNVDFEVIANKFPEPKYPITGLSQNGHSEHIKSPENE